MSELVVNCRKARYDVYIGRPGPLGNPFVIGRNGTREEVIAKHRDHLLSSPGLLAMLPGLRGKVLGCFCAPLPCHGDAYALYANDPAALERALAERGEGS